MPPNLLLCDVGNTSIKIGLADNEKIFTFYTLSAVSEMTADSVGLTLHSLLHLSEPETPALKACIVSSVVPRIDSLLAQGVERFIGCPVLFAPGDLHIPLENNYAHPEQVGADILVGAYAARVIYPAPASLIIVDYGTAVTFACVTSSKFLGGLIFPGPGVALKALATNTAKLPMVDLNKEFHDLTLGRDTSASISQGLVFGYASLTEGLCGRLSRQLPHPVKVIATGGFAKTIASASGAFDELNPLLVLEGLRLLYCSSSV